MIDPSDITKYDMTEYELEEVLIFWICVAGKTASLIARSVDNLLNSLEGSTPFEKIRGVGYKELPQKLKSCGIGCQTIKAKSLWQLVNSGIDLRTCSIDELENIFGIGRKTSRCFVMHSREGAGCAGLDTHILKFLRGKGHDVPKSTPASKKKYLEIEKLFLRYAKKSNKAVAKFDLDIWREHAYNGGKNV